MEHNKIFRVGSKNPVKLEAVSEILLDYPHLQPFEVLGVDVSSGVPDQPLHIHETVTGAVNRAKASFGECTYSLGIESGLMQVPHTKSGHMDICVCAIYDGKDVHLGISSAWEFPDPKISQLMLEEGMDMSQAINAAGLTSDPNIGSAEGAIGILTKGRLTRKAYTKEALRSALIHLENFSHEKVQDKE